VTASNSTFLHLGHRPVDSNVIGPFTKKELREAVHSGNLSWDDWAWHKELSEWKPVHALMPIIHVSRNGQEIAQFDDEKEILSGLRDGTLLMDDYYWCEGMSDWKNLSTLEISKGALATAAQKDALKRAGLPFDELTTKAQVSALFSVGKTGPNDPVTENQKDYLRSFGITAKEGLTKGEASDLIDRAKDDPAALETRNKLQLAKYEEQRTREAEFPSYHLKQMIASAAKDLEEAKDELTYQAGLRIKFWKATFPSGGGRPLDIDDWEGLGDYDEIIDRYSELGRRFKVPTNKQISDILAALDRDAPDWDKTEPERFYSSLAASFPDTVRKANIRQHVRKPGVGCLAVIVIVSVIQYLLRHLG
jgi:hypothetical protein